MTSLLAKYISKRILGESVQNNFGKEDPYFESVPATRLDGRPTGKTKKRRKALPPGISEHDGKVLTKVKRRAYRLDMSLFNCCGIRFGWGSLIGIIPGIGDVIDAFMALMVLRTCEQIEGGLPADVRSKMYINIVLDFGIGLVPFLGDIADALFRANTRNAVVLEKHLRRKGAKALKAQGHSEAGAVDPTDPEEYDRQLRQELGPPPQYTTAAPITQASRQDNTPQGRMVQPPEDRRSGGKESWFSGFGSRGKQPDPERGMRRQDGPLPSVPDAGGQNNATLQKNRR